MSDVPQGPKSIPGMSPNEQTPEDIIDVKPESKIPNLLACIAYMCLVGGMGSMLSIYYMFLWESAPPVLPEIKRH